MRGEPEVDALVERAVSIANSILQGEIEPYRGAKQLGTIEMELQALGEDLRIFYGLADAWEELPEQRAEADREIELAADRFRANWGP